MAVTQIVFGKGGYPLGSGVLPVLDFDDVTSETITPSGSNQSTTITAPLIGERPVCVIGTDTAVYVVVAASPNATNAAKRVYVPAASSMMILCNAGDKAAVVTA